MRTHRAALLAGLALVLIQISAGAATFHVSPAGDDVNSGSIDKPFKTLARARDAVRQYKQNADAKPGPIEVLLHAGTYYLPQTLIFTAEDSGTKD
jgi:hypothetical protein